LHRAIPSHHREVASAVSLGADPAVADGDGAADALADLGIVAVARRMYRITTKSWSAGRASTTG